MLKSWWDGLATDLHERWIQSWRSTVVGLVLALAIAVVDYTTSWLKGIDAPWVGAAMLLVTVVGGMLKSGAVKAKAAVLAVLLFAAPAYASGPGVFCISGCDDGMKLKAADVQISSVLWAGPGLGAAPALYNGATKEWTVAISPVFSYGIWWRPPGWTATKSLLGANLSLFGEITGSQPFIAPVATVNLMDNVQIGGGIKGRFATGSTPGGIDPLFAIFWTTSLGSP